MSKSQITDSLVKRIAIQGYEGSFHHEAAQFFFGKHTHVVPCNTFRELVKVAELPAEADGGIMAIENSIAGSILPNYKLLKNSRLRIVGEVYLQIQQNLLVNPGVQIEELKEVHSHAMAILQCQPYLDKHKWKIVETDDTALSAKKISQNHSKHIAAIAGKFAARLYNLHILASNIQSEKNNYTRFLVVVPDDTNQLPRESNKASIYFQTDHTRGSLAKVLVAIADADINLSKLQSYPIPGTSWHYEFYADMEFSSLDQFNTLIDELKCKTESLRVYGIYKKGDTQYQSSSK